MGSRKGLVRTVLAFVALAACQGERAPVSLRTDSAGVEIVRYPGADRPAPFSFVEDFRLGGSETIPEQSFFQVSAASIGSDARGNLYILDSPGNRVLVFDGGGSFIRSMGRSGSGPGELGIPAGLVVSQDGSVGVVDFAKRGLVRFDTAGGPLPLMPLPPRYFGGAIRTAGDIMILPARQPVGDVGTDALLRIDGGDTAMIALKPPSPMKAIELPSCGMGFSGMPPLFTPSLRWAANGERVAVVTGPDYDIALFADGREVRRIRRDIAPAAATEELALVEVGEAMEVRTEGGVRRCDPREVVEQRGVAATIPAVSSLSLSPDGWLWVLRGGVRDEPKPIDVFDPIGEYAGTLPAGSPFPLLFLPDGRIAAAETDDLDVTRLVVYAVERPVSGEAR
jgi:hypothetical protein